MSPPRPLILHAVHRFDVGGMENGVVNLINRLPDDFADHAVLAFTQADPSFCQRLRRPDVRVFSLHKPPGQTAWILPRIHRMLRELRPAIFHTRNVATLEAQLAAWTARVPARVHGEHGWDMGDLDGSNLAHLRIRRLMRAFVHTQIALSGPTHRYLTEKVGVDPDRCVNICNGVDVERFHPPDSIGDARDAMPELVLARDDFVVGALGRLVAVKNLPMLVTAFAMVAARRPAFRERARLLLVGDGPERDALERQAREAGIAERCVFAGARGDVPGVLRCLDMLCLPSLAEGISNAVLEAGASGVPVVATAVGGNPELIVDGTTGHLVPSGDSAALADRIEQYFSDSATRRKHASAARRHVQAEFSLQTMVDRYHRVYTDLLSRRN